MWNVSCIVTEYETISAFVTTIYHKFVHEVREKEKIQKNF